MGFLEYRAYALMPIGQLQYLMAMDPQQVHEIAASVPDPWLAPTVAERLSDSLSHGGQAIAVEPWTAFPPSSPAERM